MARPRATGAADSRCPSCGVHLLRQWVGDRAALLAVVDPAAPLTAEQQAATRTPHRLIWCLRQTPYAPPRLAWITRSHPPDCPHPHVADHACPPRQPTTLF